MHYVTIVNCVDYAVELAIMGSWRHTGEVSMKNDELTNHKAHDNLIDTNASPSAYGWCFQVGAGITLMLDNVNKFTSLKMEGASDDIELTLDTGKMYAQAKSVTQIGDQRSASTNLKDALRTLSQAAKNGDAVQLVYITNIANPLSSKIPTVFQYGNEYEFSILPADAQNKILKKAGDDFPAEKFRLHILNFFGEGENKFQSVKAKISEFLRIAIDDPSYNQRLLESWFETFMVNASDKPDNQKKLELTKRQVVYPVIVLVIDQPIKEEEFHKVSEYDDYDGICQMFRKTIYGKICDYQFVSEVLADFLLKRNTSNNNTNFPYEYAKKEWQNYQYKFTEIKDKEVQEALIKLLLLTVIIHRRKVDKIKEATKL